MNKEVADRRTRSKEPGAAREQELRKTGEEARRKERKGEAAGAKNPVVQVSKQPRLQL